MDESTPTRVKEKIDTCTVSIKQQPPDKDENPKKDVAQKTQSSNMSSLVSPTCTNSVT